MPIPITEFGQALAKHAPDFGIEPGEEASVKLQRYYDLLLRWNPRLHLVAPCSPVEFATRHVLESLLLLSHLPSGSRVIDIGSGGGLPMIPCLIVRADLHGALIESSARKTVFLHEALREVDCADRAQVIAARFEDTSTPTADFVTCRALDRFSDHLPALIEWSPPQSTLLLFVGEALRKEVQSLLPWANPELIPGSDRRFLIVASCKSPA